jgi:hypothetical protein
MISREDSAARESLRCRNCGAAAPGRYCPDCGQETTEHLPTAREFVHEFVLHYFAAEGRLWRTLGALVLHPGKLTIEYLRGRKRAYVLPLRLYLTVSVVYFLLLQVAIAPGAHRLSEALHRSLNNGHSTVTIVGLGFANAVRNPDGSFTCNLPRWLCERINERVLQPPGEFERRLSAVPSDLFGHFSTAVFLLLPVFAFYLQLAYLKRRYGEHFLFALHVHSFWFLVLLLLLLPMPQWLEWVLELYLFVYSVTALHAVYGSAWWSSVLKGLVLAVAYVATLSMVATVMAVWALVK